jgi:hypothetical protein
MGSYVGHVSKIRYAALTSDRYVPCIVFSDCRMGIYGDGGKIGWRIGWPLMYFTIFLQLRPKGKQPWRHCIELMTIFLEWINGTFGKIENRSNQPSPTWLSVLFGPTDGTARLDVDWSQTEFYQLDISEPINRIHVKKSPVASPPEAAASTKWVKVEISNSPTKFSDPSSAKRVFQVLDLPDEVEVPNKRMRGLTCRGWLEAVPSPQLS